MQALINIKFIDRVRDLTKDIIKSLEDTPENSIMLQLTKNISNNIDLLNKDKNNYTLPQGFSYSILAYLAFVQTFFAAKIKETNFTNPNYSHIYWDATGLKDYFRGGNKIDN